jgi:hypothetical protein
MIVEIDSADTLEKLKALGPMPETPTVHRVADGAQFLFYRLPAGADLPETPVPAHILEVIEALAEARTEVLAEARDARAGR